MFLHKIILKLIILLKLVNADVVICENNECKRAGLLSMDSLLYELDEIKESNRNLSKFLKEFNERIDHKLVTLTTDVENIKKLLPVQAIKASTDQEPDDKAAEHKKVDKQLYNNLWVVIQTRQDGSVDFYRNWTEYKHGFGNESGEFFIGLNKIYNLTNDRHHELLIMLEDFGGNVKFAHYDHFLIGNETERYRLKKLGKYSGTAGNHLRFHLNKFFSTTDKDNDDADEGNCAQWFKGAWWYYNCMTSNLNGPYRHHPQLNEAERGVGITWGSYDEIKYSFKGAQMLLRAKV